MQFDWFTFGASLFNFVLLLVLLRIFVFKRIIRAMDARGERIAATWDEAEQAKSDAEEQADRHRRELQEFREQADKKMQEARDEADRERERRLKSARDEVDQQRDAWVEDLRSRQEEVLSQVETRLSKATIDAVRATLHEVANADLETSMIDRFLSDYSDDATATSVQVCTSHPLPDDQRGRVTDALLEIHGKDAAIDFSVDESLLCGIEARFNDRRVGFTLADHLDRVRNDIGEIVAAKRGGSNE